MRTLSALVSLALFAGCTTGIDPRTGAETAGVPIPFVKPVESVTFPKGPFALAYADTKAFYAVMDLRIQIACQSKALSPEFCTGEYPRLKDQVQLLDSQIRSAILRNDVQADWEQIQRVFEIAMKTAKLIVSTPSSTLPTAAPARKPQPQPDALWGNPNRLVIWDRILDRQ